MHSIFVAVAAAGVVLAGSQSHLSYTATGDPVAQLGYAAYQGYHDDSYGLNIWKGYVLFPTETCG